MIKNFHDYPLINRKFRLRGGYDIEVISQSGQLVVAVRLLNGTRVQDIRKYKLDHLEYLILKEL